MTRTLSHAAHVNRDGPFGDRFWYWNGGSGRRYIHSVFRVEDCPPLPGAIYLAVRREGCGKRIVCAIGHFSSALPEAAAYLPSDLVRRHGVNEVHVHLLAEGEIAVAAILEDLTAALLPAEPQRGSAESHVSHCARQYVEVARSRKVVARNTAEEWDNTRVPMSSNLARWFPALRGILQARP